jgi:hypothetical protein
MARRGTGFKLPGFTTYVDRVSKAIAKQTAEDIVEDLQSFGPAWTGNFRDSWVILPGKNQYVPKRNRRSDFEYFKNPGAPEKIRAPRLTGKPSENNNYTIGNTASYSAIAMDLDPDQVRLRNRGITAEPDWYRKYTETDLLKDRLEESTGKVAQNPTIRGFKGGKNK